MTVSDPIGDLLTRIRNALMRRRAVVTSPSSSARERVLAVLRDEGYISDYERIESGKNGHPELSVSLRYHDGEPAIREIRRVSRPGRRVYSSVRDFQPVYNGLGISIVSTPKGIMSDVKARAENVGGEVLCTVF